MITSKSYSLRELTIELLDKSKRAKRNIDKYHYWLTRTKNEKRKSKWTRYLQHERELLLNLTETLDWLETNRLRLPPRFYVTIDNKGHYSFN